ncbi:hypothetical protein [Viridibacillus arvi]|uniref:hypothetical protein n=1 Tax=Viridibacillus arvi TaxID=263475 RepID=UPI0034CFBD4A
MLSKTLQTASTIDQIINCIPGAELDKWITGKTHESIRVVDINNNYFEINIYPSSKKVVE